MPYNPELHHRRSIRLDGYNYSQAGAYFVAICTNQRACLFGQVIDDAMTLNDAGLMLQDVWNRLPARFSTVDLDSLIVMPNHLHGIIVITSSADGVRADDSHARIGDMVGAFKSMTTYEYIGVSADASGP